MVGVRLMLIAAAAKLPFGALNLSGPSPAARSIPAEKDLMLQAFIITLREGVEAALIVGIVFAYLTKIGRSELKRTVFWALGSAIAASVAGAVIVARTHFNSDIFEGWVM